MAPIFFKKFFFFIVKLDLKVMKRKQSTMMILEIISKKIEEYVGLDRI